MMILKSLSLGPTHGYGVARRIHQMSGNVLATQEGTLYPALHRLLQRGHLISRWQQSEQNRRARYYRLSALGRRRLTKEATAWERMRNAVDVLMNTHTLPEAGS